MHSTPDPLQRFLKRWRRSVEEGSFVRTVLSGPVFPDGSPTRLTLRLIDLRGTPTLSITRETSKGREIENLNVEDCQRWLSEELGSRYQNGLLCTQRKDWQLRIPKQGVAMLVAHAPSQSLPAPRTHDEPRARVLDDSARDWLMPLGILGADGNVRASMSDKLKQIHRFVELLSHLWSDAEFPRDETIRISDMGAGKGYLTFAMWHWFHRVQKRLVDVTGVEVRSELVDAGNDIARKIGAEGLRFVPGSIASTPVLPTDVLVALHACNTATDQAILRGIESNARWILLAPCCHQDLRPQLGRPAPFDALLDHGLLEERFAEWLTDGLRALYLQWAGYETKVIEFISAEHTPKNLLITATHRLNPFTRQEIRSRIEQLQTQFEIRAHPLHLLLERKSQSASQIGRGS